MLRRRVAIDSNDSNIEQVNKQFKAPHLFARACSPQDAFVEILPDNWHLEQLQWFGLLSASNGSR